MKKIIKGILTAGIVLIFLGVIFKYKDSVFVYVDQYLSPYKYVTLGDVNEYYRDYDFEFVQNTERFVPLDEQDIINIYYTVINAGKSTFTFYCTEDYPGCLADVQAIANDRTKLSDINNYVHPYNGFSHIETEYDSLGRVTINIVRSYTPEEIDQINQKVDELYAQLWKSNDSNYNNMLRVHDWVVDHAQYDTSRSENGDSAYDSDIAYGPLFQGKAVCGGYTDLMQLFLEKAGMKSFRVSTEHHIWNAVYYNKWLHIDLTWDDPVSNGVTPERTHEFFLLTTKQLLESDRDNGKADHQFHQPYYPELKEA